MKLTNTQIKYLKDKDFQERYLPLLNSRLIYSNNRMEYNIDEIDDLFNDNILSLDDNFKAFKILLNKLYDNEPLTEELIIEVANTVNKHAMYIKNGYRSLDNNVKFESIYPIEKASNIKEKMKELLDNYNNKWSNLDIMEREALFNIEFLRIHPFEDGNGRTSRLIINYNMLRLGHAPILIPNKTRNKYFNARNNEDVEWIKELFTKESRKESIIIDTMISSYKEELDNNKKIRR